MQRWATFDCYGTLIDWNGGIGRRGKGLATALLQRTFAEFWRRGTTRTTLDVDSQNATGAVRLYERVGMHVESCGVAFEKPNG